MPCYRPLPAIRLAILILVAMSTNGVFQAAHSADVRHIQNPATPRDGSSDLYLEEIWRAGGLDDDLVFGMITQVRQDAAGNLYVMDAQLSQVHVYSPQGEHLRTLFGEGEGPGEIRGPRDLVLLNDGRVGAVQEMPGRLVFVDRQGDPAGSLGIGGAGVSHGGFCQTFSAFTDGDLLLVAGFIQTPGSEAGQLRQTSFLSSFDAQGHRLVDFAQTVNDLALADFVFDETRHLAPFWWNAAIGPGGRVFVAPHMIRYEIQVFAPGGRLEKVITRDHEPWRRSQADKDYFTDMVRAIYHGAPIEVQVAPTDHEPTIVYTHRGLRVHPDGSLWILTTGGIRAPHNGAMATFDVFDAEGVFARQVNVHGPWHGRSDAVFLLADDHAVVVTGFAEAMVTQFTGGHMTVDIDSESGSMEVIFCRLRRR
jgi:hypothetical protein